MLKIYIEKDFYSLFIKAKEIFISYYKINTNFAYDLIKLRTPDSHPE